MRTRRLGLLAALILIPALAAAEKPASWFLAGSEPASYSIERDLTVKHEGRATGRLASKGQPKGFGTMMQYFDPAQYRGKRIKFSAFVKAENITSWAGLWLRVDGPEKGRSLAFDNMQSRAIKGTRDWARYEIVLDVDPTATGIGFGILVDGPGTVWMDNAAFEVVDVTVPTTGDSRGGTQQAKPENLNFER